MNKSNYAVSASATSPTLATCLLEDIKTIKHINFVCRGHGSVRMESKSIKFEHQIDNPDFMLYQISPEKDIQENILELISVQLEPKQDSRIDVVLIQVIYKTENQ